MATLTQQQYADLAAEIQKELSSAREPVAFSKNQIPPIVGGIDTAIAQLEAGLVATVDDDVKTWAEARPAVARKIIINIVVRRIAEGVQLG